MKNRYQRILQSLQVLNPSFIDLADDSHSHAGHGSEHGGEVTGHGETHFKLVLVSEVFQGLSRIERQQKVNLILADEFKNGLHAFQMKLLSPDEQVV
jgi:BolA family transcriptional regulator, general stress-responsive regulator